MRAVMACLLVGAAGLLVLLVVALGGGTVLPAYLAAWLFGLAVPLGALALLLGMEALGLGAQPLAGTLRPLLLALPVLAVLSVPLLLGWGHLFAAAPARTGFAAGWFATPWVAVREAAFLLVWLLMALLLARPGRARGVGGALLLLHVVMLSVAATDWLGAAEPGLDSSLLGLVLLAMQCGTALSVALLLGGRAAGRATPGGRTAMPEGAAALLLGLLAAWAFLQFVQFLVVWSADLPREVPWYLHRGTGLGLGAQWLALAVLLLALALLVPAGPGRHAPVVADGGGAGAAAAPGGGAVAGGAGVPRGAAALGGGPAGAARGGGAGAGLPAAALGRRATTEARLAGR